jgi:hypothetical protein
MAIEIGNIVKCINSKPLEYTKNIKNPQYTHEDEVAPPLTEGKEYPVTDIHVCGCGKQHIGLGLKVNVSFVTCFDCEEKMPLTTHWCHPSRFEVVG